MRQLSKFPIYVLLMMLISVGCSVSKKGNEGQMSIYPAPANEAKWIRAGEPIEFENEFWFPQDGIETFLDTEVILLGDYKGVQYFVEKIDVRPFQRLYTKYGKNKFRYFTKKSQLK